jgi:hypothetical protein
VPAERRGDERGRRTTALTLTLSTTNLRSVPGEGTREDGGRRTESRNASAPCLYKLAPHLTDYGGHYRVPPLLWPPPLIAQEPIRRQSRGPSAQAGRRSQASLRDAQQYGAHR